MSRVHVGLLAMVATPGAATAAVGQQAEAPAANDRWAVTVAPYLWATALDGDATVAGSEAHVDVPFSDILKDLSFGAMLLLDVNRGRFGIGVNGLYARGSPDSDAGRIEIDATNDTVQIVVAPHYRVVDWQYGVSSSGRPLRLYVAPEAMRFTHLRTELEVRGGPTVDGSESRVEPLIGSSIGLGLSDHWPRRQRRRLRHRLGPGLEPPGAPRLSHDLFGREATFALGYRALHQDYDDKDVEWDVTMHRPFIGTATRF